MLHLYHLHLSKKQKNEERIFIDSLAYLSGIIAPFLTIPQLYIVWIQKDGVGVSIISWASYAFFNVIFVIYGLQHKHKLIVINNILWFLMEIMVVVGVIIYK